METLQSLKPLNVFYEIYLSARGRERELNTFEIADSGVTSGTPDKFRISGIVRSFSTSGDEGVGRAVTYSGIRH